jgi:hypothetical protein
MVLPTAIGVALAVAVLRSTDFTALRLVASRVGSVAVVVVMIQLGVVTVTGLAWASLLARKRRPNLGVLVGLRFIREALNVMLPFSAAGGDVIGGRLLTRWTVPSARAAASILADLTVQFFAQLLFAALGIVVLALDGKPPAVILWASAGLGMGALAVTGFFAVQRLGLSRLARIGGWWGGRLRPTTSLLVSLHDELRATYAGSRKLAIAVGLHLFAWLLGAAETYAILARSAFQACLRRSCWRA